MLNNTQQEIDKNATKDYNYKLILESDLFSSLSPIFTDYSKEYRKTLSRNGGIAPTHILHTDIKKILEIHYTKVSNKFSQRIVSEIGKPKNHEDILKGSALKNAIHNQLRAAESTLIIVDTTNRDAQQAYNQTIIDAMANGETLSARQIANRSQLKLDASIRRRLNTISATETQNPAEHAKQTEIELLDNYDADIDEDTSYKEVVKKKQWVAILDKVTRDAHADADGLIVNFNEPFIVGGQNLMFPGDDSLGATIDNIINCRCASIIVIENFDEENY